jgi:RNA polymerase subunit RPABC4/transcription elongation factor Spt4
VGACRWSIAGLEPDAARAAFRRIGDRGHGWHRRRRWLGRRRQGLGHGLLAASWIVISSPLLMPFALGIYTLARPQHTAAQGRSRRLVEELVEQLEAEDGGLCPTCSQAIDVDWLRCPTCSTWLATPCSNCGGWSDRSLDICPWCGNEERDEPQVELRRPAPAPSVPRKPRRRQSRRQPVGAMAFDSRQPRGRLEALLDARPPARAGSR